MRIEECPEWHIQIEVGNRRLRSLVEVAEAAKQVTQAITPDDGQIPTDLREKIERVASVSQPADNVTELDSAVEELTKLSRQEQQESLRGIRDDNSRRKLQNLAVHRSSTAPGHRGSRATVEAVQHRHRCCPIHQSALRDADVLVQRIADRPHAIPADSPPSDWPRRSAHRPPLSWILSHSDRQAIERSWLRFERKLDAPSVAAADGSDSTTDSAASAVGRDPLARHIVPVRQLDLRTAE